MPARLQPKDEPEEFHWVNALADRVWNENKKKSDDEIRKLVGVGERQLRNWRNAGRNLELKSLVKLLNATGGNIEWALPWNKPSKASEMAENSTLNILGSVAAGFSKISYPDSPIEKITAQKDLWENSPFYARTEGPIIGLRISGDSMYPEYQDREIVVCRKPGGNLIEQIVEGKASGTPCVFSVDQNEHTFKILRYHNTKDFIGEPINPICDTMVFDMNRTEITYIVLGKIGMSRKIR